MAALRLSSSSPLLAAAGDSGKPAAYCRVCFEAGGTLVSPCSCAGSSAHIHRHCLRRWQRSALASENPSRAQVCGVCRSAYQPIFRIGRGKAARWGRKEEGGSTNSSSGDDEDDEEEMGEEDEGGGASFVAGLGRKAAGALESLLSPGCLLKSVTIFGLALLVPYFVLAYYAILALSYIDPFDGSGRLATTDREARRRAAREAAAAAVTPGRTFLVASNRISPGSVFHQAVVLVLEHGAWGSRGVIVNKALRRAHPGLRAATTTAGGRALLDALAPSSSASACPLLLGGPVDPHVLTLVHNDTAAIGAGGEGGDGGPAARWEVAPGLFVATTEEGEGGDNGGAGGNEARGRLLGLLSRWSRRVGGPPGPGPGPPGVVAARAFFGYAGWSARQLPGEIRRGDWHVFDADPEVAAELLFELALEDDEPETIPSTEAEDEEEGQGEGRLMDEGALLWRELVASVGEGEEEGGDED